MSKFVLSTKKSLYKPIEIEVDGTMYIIDRISPQMLEEAKKFEKKALEGEVSALIEQLSTLTGIKKEIAVQLDVRDISELLKYLTDKIFKPEERADKEEKNESGPADSK